MKYEGMEGIVVKNIEDNVPFEGGGVWKTPFLNPALYVINHVNDFQSMAYKYCYCISFD